MTAPQKKRYDLLNGEKYRTVRAARILAQFSNVYVVCQTTT